MWFQTVGFLILISPLHSIAVKNLNSDNNLKLLAALFTISLASTLMGHIAGSLTFEMLSWPTLIPDVNVWKTVWQAVTFLYPVERIVIALNAAFLGVALRRLQGVLESK